MRRLPAVATRPTKRRGTGTLSPKMSVLVLLALFAQVARRSKTELTVAPASVSAMASVACKIRMAEVLEDLGYQRCGFDFSGSAWSAVSAAVRQLAETDVRLDFLCRGPEGFVKAHFAGPLVEKDDGQLRLYGYSPSSDKYFVLVPRKLLSLRAELTELGTRLVCWLYLKHRGRRVDRKLQHKWDLAITPEILVDAKVLKAKNCRRVAELKRMREGFRNLESLGLLAIEGAGWPFRVQLSRQFFRSEVPNA
jgi:hypothetical protein